VGRKKFEALGSAAANRDAVVELVCVKWLLQLWADDDVLRDVELLKRVWDCLFLSAGGCLSMSPPESALKAALRSGVDRLPRATDFHLRLAVAMIKDTPILAGAPQEEESGPRARLQTGASWSHTSASASASAGGRPSSVEDRVGGALDLRAAASRPRPPRRNRSSTSFGETNAGRHHSDSEGGHDLYAAMVRRPSLAIDVSLLRRKASVEEMGAHATGFIMETILNRTRGLSSRKLEDLIVLAEHISLVRPSSARRKEMLEQEALEAAEKQYESRNVLEFIKKLCMSKPPMLLGYATFKRLANEACPEWETKDIMEVFATVDVARNGRVSTHYMMQQLPHRFPERALEDLCELASHVCHWLETAQPPAQPPSTPPLQEEACRTTPRCAVQ
jgi:hypothetical protein